MILRGKHKMTTCTFSGRLLIWSRTVIKPTRAQRELVELAGWETGLCSLSWAGQVQ